MTSHKVEAPRSPRVPGRFPGVRCQPPGFPQARTGIRKIPQEIQMKDRCLSACRCLRQELCCLLPQLPLLRRGPLGRSEAFRASTLALAQRERSHGGGVKLLQPFRNPHEGILSCFLALAKERCPPSSCSTVCSVNCV